MHKVGVWQGGGGGCHLHIPVRMARLRAKGWGADGTCGNEGRGAGRTNGGTGRGYCLSLLPCIPHLIQVAYFLHRSHSLGCAGLAANSVSAQTHIFTAYSSKEFPDN